MITFCLMTCGEETDVLCLLAIAPFRKQIVLQEVRNVCPQAVALNQMLQQVETPYLVPLDADMLLFPNALERIQQAIHFHESDPRWHSILFKLYDTLTEKNILALKVLRTEVVKKFPFSDSPTPDIEHFHNLTLHGYTCIQEYLREEPIGRHVVQGERFCYYKYRDVYMTLRFHERVWDSGVFLGGETLREKAQRHFEYFLTKYFLTDKQDYLCCLAGMVDGLTSSQELGSKTLREQDFRIPPEEAVKQYFLWYQQNFSQDVWLL